jgi:hypothetical protein
VRTMTATKTEQPKRTRPTTFRIKLKASHWLPLTGITMEGAKTAEEARQQLHDDLDRHIIAIEKGR